MAFIYIVFAFRDPVPLILVIFHKDIVQHNFPSRLSNTYKIETIPLFASQTYLKTFAFPYLFTFPYNASNSLTMASRVFLSSSSCIFADPFAISGILFSNMSDAQVQ